MQKLRPPLLFIMSIFLMIIVNRFAPILTFIPVFVKTVGSLSFVLGLSLSFWGSSLFKKIGTNINTFNEPGTLVIYGPFKFTRNPMYLGFTIALSGVATSLGSVGPFSILFVFIAITHFWYIPFEERWLTKKFGEEYENYKKCTPRWLLQVKRTP